MKVLDTPRTGKLGVVVYYPSPFGVCGRGLAIPRDPHSEAQTRARGNFGASSRGYGLILTEPQREHWNLAALTVPSHPSLSQYAHLSGQQFCVKINNTLRQVGQPPVTEPPQPVVFSPIERVALTADYDENGAVRLLLSVGTVVEDLMLYGQAPCSAGRMKHRRVCYLSLLGLGTNGQRDITAQYTARFGEPRPGQKVFVVICQQKNGWKGEDHVASTIVPPRPVPGDPQKRQETQPNPAPAAPTPEAQSAPIQSSSSLSRAVYNGSTADAHRVNNGPKCVHPWCIRGTPVVHGVRMALARLGVWGMARIGA